MIIKWFEIIECRARTTARSGSLEVGSLTMALETLSIDHLEDHFQTHGVNSFPFNYFNALSHDLQFTKENIQLALSLLLKGETLIEVGEDGTCGITIEMDEVQLMKEVKVADYDAKEGWNISSRYDNLL